MARPTTKQELIVASNEQFENLWKLINSMPIEEQNAQFPFEDRDKNTRDVLVHLQEWHQMLEQWYEEGTVKGLIPAVPGEGYTWKTLPVLNLEIWKKYQHVSLDDSKLMLKKSHNAIMKLVENHSNEELFSKSIYKWTKSTTLGAYFVSATSSHYDWAMKKIKQHIKKYRQQTTC